MAETDTKLNDPTIENNDDSASDSGNDSDKESEEQKLVARFDKHINFIREQIKALQAEKAKIHELQKDIKKKIVSKKSKKKKKSGNSNSAFKLPVKISPELCNFLDLEKGSEIPRTEVTKRLCAWVKKHPVKNDKDKRIINIGCRAAAPLKKIMSEIPSEDKKKFTCFTMQKYIQHHYLKDEVETEAEVEKETTTEKKPSASKPKRRSRTKSTVQEEEA